MQQSVLSPCFLFHIGSFPLLIESTVLAVRFGCNIFTFDDMHVRTGGTGIYCYSSDVSCTMFTYFCSCAHFHPPDSFYRIVLQILPCCRISFQRSSGRSVAGWFGLLCFYVRLSQRMYGTLGKDIRLNRIVPSIFGLHCHRCDDVRYSLVSGR